MGREPAYFQNASPVGTLCPTLNIAPECPLRATICLTTVPKTTYRSVDKLVLPPKRRSRFQNILPCLLCPLLLRQDFHSVLGINVTRTTPHSRSRNKISIEAISPQAPTS